MLRLQGGLAELWLAGQGDWRLWLLYDEVRLEAVRDERSIRQPIMAQAKAGPR